MFKNKLRCFCKILVGPILGLSFFLLGSLCLCFTKDFQLDYLSYQIVNYNSVPGTSKYNPAIFNVKRNFGDENNVQEKLYTGLFQTYHYNQLVNGARVLVDNNTSFLIGTKNFEIKLTSQPTFSVDKNLFNDEEFVHNVDAGQYFAYFEEIVSRHRGPSNSSFIFISDTIADKLVEYYQINGETQIDKYRTLILDEKYAFCSLKIDDDVVPVTINNVLHSNYPIGQATRFFEVYGDFGLIWLNRISSLVNTSFDIDLKTNPYGNKQVIHGVNGYGYNTSNSVFVLKTFEGGQYLVNNNLTNSLVNALHTDELISTICVFAFLVVNALCVYIVCVYYKKMKFVYTKHFLLASLAFFGFVGILMTYLYVYPFTTITLFTFIVTTIVVARPKILMKCLFDLKTGEISHEDIYI